MMMMQLFCYFFNSILLFSKVQWFQAEMTHSCQVFVFRQCNAKCSVLWTLGWGQHRCGRNGADNRFWSFRTAAPVVMKVDVCSSHLKEPCMNLHLAVKENEPHLYFGELPPSRCDEGRNSLSHYHLLNLLLQNHNEFFSQPKWMDDAYNSMTFWIVMEWSFEWD